MPLPTIEENQPGVGIYQLQPENKNPLLQTHYRFELRRIPTISYSCHSANIPGVNISTVDQNTLFNPIKRPGGAIQQEEFTMRFIVYENLQNWIELFTWIKQCSNYEDFTEYQEPSKHFSSDGTLFILDNLNNPRMKVVFSNMFPVRLSGLNFDSSLPDSNPHHADVSFAYTTFEVIPA